ncbi:MAG: Hpt domain-containing protein [candidate division WOR-3 bacterium]
MEEEKRSKKIKVYVPEYAMKLIPNFIENRERDIKTIESSLEKEDFKTIERIGHSIKGSGATYGFEKLSEVGGVIEESARNKDIVKIKNSLEEMKNYLDNVEFVSDQQS